MAKKPSSRKKIAEPVRAGGATAVGAATGWATSSYVGGMGLSVAGTAISLPVLSVVAAGAVVGLAGYGVWRAFSK